MQNDLSQLPLESIYEPFKKLRPVDRESVEYLELCSSISKYGLLNSLLVRPHPTKPGYYETCDGLWRRTAACEMGLKTVPCVVRDMDDTEFLALQVQANAIQHATTNVEYCRRMNILLDKFPGMGLAGLASLMGKSPSWVESNLNLKYLNETQLLLVERGQIPVKSAYLLSKIVPDIREEYVDMAMQMPYSEFSPIARKVIRDYRNGHHEARSKKHRRNSQSATPHLRPVRVLKKHLNDSQTAAQVIAGERCRTMVDAYLAALRWAVNMDRESLKSLNESL